MDIDYHDVWTADDRKPAARPPPVPALAAPVSALAAPDDPLLVDSVLTPVPLSDLDQDAADAAMDLHFP